MKQFLQVVVSVNVEGHGKARFRLVYEDLLQRHVSRYQHIVHVNLHQVQHLGLDPQSLIMGLLRYSCQ